ncbi:MULTISPECIES: GntR family transcriptional regulator [Paracoccus]|jgi:GntR family histidine utilization transcriptional repressor|uniref:GntR family transcriptional regulator n=1 Tax=Paracoccus TaxID=265 RepID=UPI000697636B|nr:MULTISPECIES: GntR family transcriptional regulator [Paracoccus]QXI65084.1 Mannosyl-D-glycerate transport/metabolism system repressor MngR [Paracoccus marcusii]TYP67598.1 GntR family transcriptional regulator [Stutzerimonas stutzeri]
MAKLSQGSSVTIRSSGVDAERRRLNTWQAIRADVLGRIRSGEWPPGSLIPTEQMLSIEMGCARATVNRALRELADSGIIQRRRKVGTRVTATTSRRTTLSLPVLRDEIESLGARYAYQMTECLPCNPSPAAMQALQVDADDMMLLVKSRYLADDRPHCCEAIWLNPRALALPDFHLFAHEPPQEWLARSLPVTQSRFSILAEGASGSCAVNLTIDPGTPVMTIERVNTLDSLPVSFARQFYPPMHRLVLDD